MKLHAKSKVWISQLVTLCNTQQLRVFHNQSNRVRYLSSTMGITENLNTTIAKTALGSASAIFAITLVKFLLKAQGFLKPRNDRPFAYLFPPGKVEETSPRHGGELVAQVLKAHGVKFIFTLVGGHVSPILVASEKIGIKVIDTRHEVTTVFAADATARLSGTVGVSVVTAGPGVTNTITAVKNGQMAESPFLIIGGAAATLAKGRGALQDIEQLQLLKTVCKATYTVTAVRQITSVLKRACQEALSGTPGPVFVEMPIDVLYPYQIIARESKLKDPKGFFQWLTAKYINHHMSYLFSGAFEDRNVSPLPVNIPHPKESQIQQSIDLLRKAKRPIIIVGSQATLPPVPIDEVPKALNKIGIPVFLGGMARGLLGSDCKLQMRHKRKDALKDADLVILAGAICDFRLGYGRSLPKNANIIAVNRNYDKLHLNSKQFWSPTIAVQSDVAEYIMMLSKSLGDDYKCDTNWIETLRKREDEREVELVQKADQITQTHLNPLKVLQSLDKILPDNAILVADGGDFVASAAYILRPRSPLAWLDPGPFGTLGVGAGFALGAKLCRPESEVWIIYGDGSCGYSVIEYDTFARHKVPIISLVGNDAAWTQIEREQVPMFGSHVACKLEYSNYHDIVSALGGKGFLVNRENENNLNKVFLEAQAENAQGRSVLINVLIGTTDFRDGSISV